MAPITEDAYAAMISRGAYTPAEAARLLGANPATVRAWVKGRSASAGPVFHRDYDELDGGKVVLSFQDLIELWVVDQLRRKGMSLQHIRRLGTRAAQMLGTTHPFGTSRVKLFVERDKVKTLVVEDDHGWTDLEDGQMLVRQVLEDYFEHVDFDPESGDAVLFWPKGKDVPVVVDPRRCYGAPVIKDTRIPAEMVWQLLKAGDSIELIASSYGLSVEAVEAARDFMLPRAA